MPTHYCTARAKNELLAFAVRTTGILCIKLDTAMHSLGCIALALGFIFIYLKSPHELIGIIP